MSIIYYGNLISMRRKSVILSNFAQDLKGGAHICFKKPPLT